MTDKYTPLIQGALDLDIPQEYLDNLEDVFRQIMKGSKYYDKEEKLDDDN